MVNTIEELASTERTFLHDISNQLVVAQGMANIAVRNAKESSTNIEQKIIDKMEKSLKAIDNMIVMLKERRQVIHSIS